MNKYKELSTLIKNSNKITFFTGAGMSTKSGIPDFRSTNGLWKEHQSFEDLISRYYFESKPKIFWEYFKEVFAVKLLGNYKPNEGHFFISELEKKGKEITIITQNIDGLHQKAGSSKVFEVHGTLKTATCPKCKTKYELDYIIENDIPRCNKENSKSNICNFILKPDVVLYGDEIINFNEALDAAYNSELFIVLGSSLKVSPINSIPSYISRTDIPMIIINNEQTKLDNLFDICIYDDISETFNKASQTINRLESLLEDITINLESGQNIPELNPEANEYKFTTTNDLFKSAKMKQQDKKN